MSDTNDDRSTQKETERERRIREIYNSGRWLTDEASTAALLALIMAPAPRNKETARG